MKTNLLIIGAGRSGTTSIYEYLKAHPNICFSKIKEIHYFSIEEIFKKGEQYYHSFYNYDEKTHKLFASADTYLFIAQNEIIKRIYDYNPQMKFIVMLRNPVDRAFSGYRYAINNGHMDKKISFIDSLKIETDLLNKNISIVRKNNLCNAFQSKYFYHLSRWTKIFPKENFLLLKTADLKENPNKILNKITTFFEIEKFNTTEKIKANTAKKVKSKKIEQILLNRNLKIRRIISKITPNKLKQKIFDSGIIDKMHKLNKTNAKIKKITEQERVFAEKLFSDDLEKLNSNFDTNLK